MGSGPASAASGGGGKSGGGDVSGAGSNFDPSAGMGGFDPSLGFGNGFDPSSGGGMGTDFGSFTGAPIPGDPTGSLGAQQSITGAVPGSQQPLSDQPGAASQQPQQQQAPPPQQQQQQQQPYKTASEALFRGPGLTGTPGGQQFASLETGTATDTTQNIPWGPDPNTDATGKLASADMPLPPQPPPSQTAPSDSSFNDRFQPFAKPATESPDRPLWSDTMLPPQPLNPQTTTVTPPTATPSTTSPATPSVATPETGGTQAGGAQAGGAQGMPQSPLEQLVGQFLHMMTGGGGPLSGLEQMLMRALGIHPRMAFPQYYGGGFNPPPPTSGSGYFPAGTAGGRSVAPWSQSPSARPGLPGAPRPQSPPGTPQTPETTPSALPPPPRRPSFPSATGGTEDIPRPPGEIGPSYDPSKYARALVKIESGGNPNQRTGSNTGLIQFGPDEYRKYMSDIPRSLWHTQRAQMIGLQRETQDLTNVLRQQLGRNPTPAELYLTHQQGVGGGPALLKAAEADPNKPAWQALREIGVSDRRAKMSIGHVFDGQLHPGVHGNIPSDNPLYNIPVEEITAGQFVAMWRDRFNRAMQ